MSKPSSARAAEWRFYRLFAITALLTAWLCFVVL